MSNFHGVQVGNWIFDGVCWLLLRYGIDDPLSAFPMHGACGIWGVFVTGLLAQRSYVDQYYERSGMGKTIHYGLFYGNSGKLLASQVRSSQCIQPL